MFMLYKLQVAVFMIVIFVHSHVTNMEDDLAADGDDLHLTGWHDSLKA